MSRLVVTVTVSTNTNIDIDSRTSTDSSACQLNSFVWRNGLKIKKIQKSLNKKVLNTTSTSSLTSTQSTSVDNEPEYYQRYSYALSQY